jgi:hypothetical protein
MGLRKKSNHGLAGSDFSLANRPEEAPKFQQLRPEIVQAEQKSHRVEADIIRNNVRIN